MTCDFPGSFLRHQVIVRYTASMDHLEQRCAALAAMMVVVVALICWAFWNGEVPEKSLRPAMGRTWDAVTANPRGGDPVFLKVHVR